MKSAWPGTTDENRSQRCPSLKCGAPSVFKEHSENCMHQHSAKGQILCVPCIPSLLNVRMSDCQARCEWVFVPIWPISSTLFNLHELYTHTSSAWMHTNYSLRRILLTKKRDENDVQKVWIQYFGVLHHQQGRCKEKLSLVHHTGMVCQRQLLLISALLMV